MSGGKKNNKKVRTRFAPSPTGDLHIGSLRTALYSFALAKHLKGTFILRIEDTDKKREVKGSLEQIKNLMKAFGLNWDEYYIQSERLELYQEAAKKLVSDGYAFYCQCEAKNAKEGYSKQLRDSCRNKNLDSGAVKLKVPDGEGISFIDFVLNKKVFWGTSTVADTTLLKSDGFPTYHLAVVVDDHAMKITHALRGHDWMPSTPVHLLVYKYLSYDLPEIGHLTDILDPEGGKLSKRKGSVSCNKMLEDGYLHEALLNFVMLLGWAPKNDREFYTLDEFVKVFDRNGLQKANPIFDRNKLDWMNGEYIRKLKVDELSLKLMAYGLKLLENVDGERLDKIVSLAQDRIKTLKEFETLAGFFFKKPKVDKKLFGENWEKHIEGALSVLEETKEWNLDNINKVLMALVEEKEFKTGKFFMSLLIAICGSKFTPPINESIEILGKEETVERLKILNNKS
ncbi:glutamate--tRNA ligase [Patescibacteria group bacterium]|nr:glutamate--tRNA ligase [Patescibacteria group bacterium]